jgi:hypothetical protein
MSHTTCTQGNWVNSQLLVVGNQIVNLTPDLSFGHNLCFKCPNEWCEPIINIYVSIAFQWYKLLLKPLGFDPCNHSLNIWESIGTPPPKVEALLGVWRFIPHTFLHSWASLLARNLASPCLGHEPKARVVTKLLTYFTSLTHLTMFFLHGWPLITHDQ